MRRKMEPDGVMTQAGRPRRSLRHTERGVGLEGVSCIEKGLTKTYTVTLVLWPMQTTNTEA